MEMNLEAAQRLLEAAMEDTIDSEDSEDCPSDDEEIERHSREKTQKKMALDQQQRNEEREETEDNFHKMKNIQDRKYQTELIRLAKDRNIIICLPTGSGKTYIALKVAEHYLPLAIEKKQKIIFLANNVPLVNQQAKYFSQNLVSTFVKDDGVVRAITGDLNVDIWKQEQWDDVMNSYHILVASTQIILDALNKNFIRWNQIRLLILDECHHAQKSHPMAELMKLYGKKFQAEDSELPRVLGLTATIIKGQSKAEQIAQDIEDIEQLLCCKAVTHRNYEEVLKRGWTVFLVNETSDTSLAADLSHLEAFLKTGIAPSHYEILHNSARSHCSNEDVRNSTSTILEIRPYTSNYLENDPVCEDINKFIEVLSVLPKNFGTSEEISIIERINHPSLTSEEQIYNKNKGAPKMLKSFLTDLLKTFRELGPYCCKLASIYKALYLIKWIRELDGGGDASGETDSEEEIEMQDASILNLVECAKTAIFQFMNKLDKMMDKEARRACSITEGDPKAWIVKHCVSEKVKLLWKILMTKRPSPTLAEDDQLCGLIFCERRITAQVLKWYLKEAAELWKDELGFVKPDVLVGHSTIVGDTELARFTAKRQSKIVTQFHQGKLNLLVATQVVEEGLNVPACNLVVRLDSINTYPSFVQSLGRARKAGALCYALIDNDNRDKEKDKIQSYVRYNEKLSSALELNAIHVGENDEDDDVVCRRIVDQIPPYKPKGDDGPIITATDAISLVHRYCNTLSCDKIAALIPYAWRTEEVMENRKYFKAMVLLPIMSGIRDVVQGDWMPDKTLAKRSAYMKCCKLLDEAGEFTENLLPKPRTIEDFKCEFLDNLHSLYEAEKETTTAKIGTKGRAQWYRKKIPKAFTPAGCSTTIEENTQISMYRVKIQLDLTKFRGLDFHKILYNFAKSGKCFGIVTTVNLKGLPKFNLKANYGELDVSIKKVSTTTLTKDQIESLEHFQSYLRQEVYGIRHLFVETDPQRNMFVVPLENPPDTAYYKIDWNLIWNLLQLGEDELLLSPNDSDRQHMEYEYENYKDAVVIPWYKEDPKPELMCVIEETELNATSDFDDTTKYRTYEEYFRNKYGCEVFHPEYPLLACKEIGTQLNFLSKKVDAKQLRKEMQSARSVLKMIPELVNVHVLPASLYLQGKFLPSILHRISRLLLANELRLNVASYFENWDVDHANDMEVDKEECDTSGGEDEDDGDEEIVSLADRMKNMAPSMVNGKRKEKKKRKFQLMEDVNPLLASWGDLEEVCPIKTRNSIRDNRFSLPEPPSYRSETLESLIDIDKVECYNFDTETDFGVECGPSMETLMETSTLSNAQDNIDLEKLEVMGDSVLKLIVSVHVFANFPRWDEGKMTQMRMKLISNLHLYQVGKQHNLGELLSGSFFIPDKSWLPLGFVVPENLVNFIVSKQLDYADIGILPKSMLQSTEQLEGRLTEFQNTAKKSRSGVPHTTYTHSHIGDKSVADCMEAIIGAYYLNGGIDGAFRIMDYLGLRAPLQDGSHTKYSRETIMKIADPPSTKPQNHIPFLQNLEKTIRYKFKNPWWAVEALTHPTFMGNRETSCYERLEYVGDALLDFLVTNYILKNTKITDPGKITDLRAALVNNVTFGSLAIKFGFQTYLKYDSEPLKNFIEEFRAFQDRNNFEVCDPCKLLTDLDTNNVQEIEVPKVLGDIFESMAGAVFVDSGMSIDTVWKIFYPLMKTELEKFSENIPKSPLRELYELFPGKVKFIKFSDVDYTANPKSKYHAPSKFTTVFVKVPGHDIACGHGTSIKQAKQAAAKYIIRKRKYPEGLPSNSNSP